MPHMVVGGHISLLGIGKYILDAIVALVCLTGLAVSIIPFLIPPPNHFL